MNKLYMEDLENIVKATRDINKLKNKMIFVTGANGMIGSFLVDLFMYLNKKYKYNIIVVANSRSEDKLEARFKKYIGDEHFKYYIGDINDEIFYDGNVDYIINCASNTHPLQYAKDPIGTIMTNIKGAANVLDFATKTKAKMVFLSSVEIYGENIYNIARFKENEMGYIDCNTLRAGYNEAKRCGEALCQAYIEQNDIDVSIVRLPRIYGPTVKRDDTKVISQFINCALRGEDIVLKSTGEQYFSYLYVADAVSGILRCILAGKCGEVYNLGYLKSDIRLKDLAKIAGDIAKVKVVFELPSEVEQKGFSKATVARLDYTKAEKELEWEPIYSIEDGVRRTIEIMKAEA